MVMIQKRSNSGFVTHLLWFSIVYLCSSIFLFPNENGIAFKIGSRLSFIAVGIFYIAYKKLKVDKDILFWCTGLSCLAIITTVNSVSSSESISIYIQLLQALIICLTLSTWLRNTGQYRFLFNTIISLSVLYCVRLSRYLTEIKWGTRKIGFMLGTNANSIGLKLAIASSIALYMYYRSEGKYRIVYLLSNLLFGGMIIATGSRRALFLWIISFMIFAYKHATDFKKKIKAVIVIMVAVITVYVLLTKIDELYVIIGFRIENMVKFLFSGDESQIGSADTDRLNMIKEGMELFWKKPLLGWGMGTFRIVSTSGHYYSHNNYVELLFSMGIFSIPIYYSIIVKKMMPIIQNRIKSTESVLCSVMVLEILVSDLFSPNYYSVLSHLMVAIVASMLECSILNDEDNNESKY